MRDRVHDYLSAVQRRQRLSLLVRYLPYGVLLGGLGLTILATRRLLGGDSQLWVLGLTSVGPILAALGFAMIHRLELRSAATAVDKFHGLKDRAVTAFEFAALPQATPLQQLQMAETLRRFEALDSRAPVSLRVPRVTPFATILMLIGGALFLIPLATRSQPTDEPAASDPRIVAQANVVAAELADLEKQIKKLSEEGDLPEAKELAKSLPSLKKELDKLRQPGADLRVALAKISQLEMAIDRQRKAAEFNLAAVDQHLKSVGEAMSLSDAFPEVAKQLRNGNYKKAADELDRMDTASLPPKAARDLSNELQRLSAKMKSKGQRKLAGASRDLAKGLKNKNPAQARKAASEMAAISRAQGLRQKMANMLGAKLGALAESKMAVRTKGGSNSQNTAQAKSPSEKFGTGQAEKNASAKRGRIASKRDRKKLRGAMGDGPSEKEVVGSRKAEQKAMRGYRDRFAKFRQLSEAVLKSEPLPMSHRQTIRHYFQSIRPTEDNAGKGEDNAGKATKD